MKLASLFSDHAVLQCEMSVPVWGWTHPLMPVVVKLGSYSAQSLSGADGRFLVRLPPMKRGGPFTLEVSSPDTDEKAVARDVWVGEVWLASGQSNMQFTIADLGQENSAEARENLPTLRMASVANTAHAGRQSDATLAWESANPQTIGDFSAVAYHFARDLQKALGVAVGIINASWGGTIIEAWTSRETLIRNSDMASRVARYEATTHSPEYWRQRTGQPEQDPFPLDPGNDGLKNGWANANFDDASWKSMKLPAIWQSQGHCYSGVFWFRKTIDVPSSWAGKDLVLNLGAADKQDITYFNGQQIGATGTGLETVHWNQPRTYPIPGHLVKAGQNVIASRVYSFVFAGGLIGPANRMTIAPRGKEDQSIALAGEWKYAVEHNLGFVTPPAPVPGPGCHNSPYILFDNMIAPLIPYAIRGAIWYQGESNADHPREYHRLMPDLIRDWRQAWGQGDFPFLMVQLANYASPSYWPLLREAQLKSLCEPNTGLAVTIDIGNPMDVHPANKRDVGHRLARWALAGTYGIALEPSGPLYSGMTVEGSQIRLHFTHVGGGLVSKNGPLKTFVIAGEDRKFIPADAVIDGQSILVSSPVVASPVAVRYAWANDPEGCNFYNVEGLPASPFRTDTW